MDGGSRSRRPGKSVRALGADARERGAERASRPVLSACIHDLIAAGCATTDAVARVGYPRASWYRHQRPAGLRAEPIPQAQRFQPHALDAGETAQIVAWLSEDRFADMSVQQVFWEVFDEGHFVASMRTWYRIASRRELSGDRRRQATHPPKTIPELIATGPNQVWSWDITRIRVKTQRSSLHLYLIEDVFSRRCVGWRLEQREQDEMAADLIENTVLAERAKPHTLHADGGPSMTSTKVHDLLDQLGVDASHSRPQVSNDCEYQSIVFGRV